MNRRIDSPLFPLTNLDHPVADLVDSFLDDTDDWSVDDFFLRRIQACYEDPGAATVETYPLDGIDFRGDSTPITDVRLLSLSANFFRGFRKNAQAIDLSGDLVVIDGGNSTGKTSLAEAIEWLLTGRLVRREHGDAKELANCITNRFKKPEEDTWVEAVFKRGDDSLTYRRKLVKDYGAVGTAECDSTEFVNGKAIHETNYVLNRLFSGVTPLLMQHTIQKFVVDPARKRRDYFEHLLNVDDVSALIQKAVVGEDGLSRFERPGGTGTIVMWQELLIANNRASSVSFDVGPATERKGIAASISSTLLKIATDDFAVSQNVDIDTASLEIKEVQRRVLQKKFPLVARLQPKRSLDVNVRSQISSDSFEKNVELLREAKKTLDIVESANVIVTAGQQAIAGALDTLREAGIIDQEKDQTCPLCDYRALPTLTATRIKEISEWDKARRALQKARREFNARIGDLVEKIKLLRTVRSELVPMNVDDSDWNADDEIQHGEIFSNLREAYRAANTELTRFDLLSNELLRKLMSKELNARVYQKLGKILCELPNIATQASIYVAEYSKFERLLESLASVDQTFESRNLWLSVFKDRTGLLEDVLWDNAKKSAMSELESIRSSLMKYRQDYLEGRRTHFSKTMSRIWCKLREDRYSSFGQILIPKPSGRGYPVRIEVTAVLNDSVDELEVDALSVLSESQINAIAIAAFITRSNTIGHQCLIMDDPVQSMDADHFRTFADALLRQLSDDGFQVIVLTHNDRFARDISHCHYDRRDYVTMGIRHSRREGIRIEEGNRRVAERLKLAEKLVDDGRFEDAWKTIRLAMERLYLVAYIKHGPDSFDPRSWANHTATNMWSEGVNRIIREHAPESEPRLKDILDLAASGAHDKVSEGETSVRRAIKDIKPLLNILRVGG